MDCPSCGTTGQTKERCEACGFAFPHESADDANDVLSLFLGLVCATCDGYNDPGTDICVTCGAPLGAGDSAPEAPAPAPAPTALPVSAPPSWMTPPSGQPLSTQFAMKKVDLSVIAQTTPVSGLAAPTPAPMPAPPRVPPPTPTVATPPATPPASTPQSAARFGTCWRCQCDLEEHDKFCRACGARVDGAERPAASGVGTVGAVGAAAAATQVIASLKLPSAPALQPSSSSTMVIPAMKVAASAPAAAPAGPTATMVFGAVTAERVAKLILVRGHTQFGSQWRLQAGETLIGRSEGMVLFPEDTAIAAKHARLVWRGAALMLEPLPSTNGVYIRLREPTRLQPGDEFLVGAQRLRLLADGDRPMAMPPGRDDTRLLGSAIKPTPPIALLRVSSDPAAHELYFRAQRLLTIGRAHCDVMFPDDGFVSERHAQLTHEDSHVALEDLGSRNGTYVRARVATALSHGDLLLLGDQVLRVELPQR